MASAYQVYVTFSGEKGEKIQNVGAYAPDGSFLGDVLAGGGPFDELRGLAVDERGRLYVANAYKKASAVDVFSATINAGRFFARLSRHADHAGDDGARCCTRTGSRSTATTCSCRARTPTSCRATRSPARRCPRRRSSRSRRTCRSCNPKGDYYGGTFVASADPGEGAARRRRPRSIPTRAGCRRAVSSRRPRRPTTIRPKPPTKRSPPRRRRAIPCAASRSPANGSTSPIKRRTAWASTATRAARSTAGSTRRPTRRRTRTRSTNRSASR